MTTMNESVDQMLERLGANGMKWAEEFRLTAIKLGYSDMDVGWLVGWFANAIEYGHMVKSKHEVHLAPREVSDEDVLGALTRLYTSGYKAGHHYTVEAGYTDVVYSDSSTYFREELVELLKDSDYEAITAALKEAGK